MDIFNAIGKNLESFAEQAKDLTKRVNIGAKEASKVTKIKFQLKEQEGQLNILYRDLGEAYYMEMRNQGHRTDKSSSELLMQLDEVITDIERLENLIKYGELNEGSVKYCLQCHAELSEGDKFCRRCGTPVPQEIIEDEDIIEVMDPNECPYCHHELSEDASYCPGCGHEVDWRDISHL